MTPLRLWVDTDVGDDPDDAIALLAAEGADSVDLVGVSTVDGHHDRRTRLARALVSAPVHGGDDPSLSTVFRDVAPEALLAIGPLTNVAALLQASVGLPPLTAMGGLIGTTTHWGSTRRVEHNFERDPDAAALVLAQHAPVELVPLDVTVHVRLGQEEAARLLKIAPVLGDGVARWLEAQGSAGVPPADRAVFLHDPLAFLALTDPALVGEARMRLAVEADGRVVEREDAPEQRVVRRADRDAVVSTVLRLVARGVG